MKRVASFVLAAALSAIAPISNAAEVKICTDNNFWYPFTLVKDGTPAGIHVDIITRALTNLGHEARIQPLPWLRCLQEAEKGLVDGIATSSYKPDRAEYLRFPENAATEARHPLAVSQVEYVVVTTTGDSYEFNGDVKTLPTPIRAPRGYSVVDDLTKEGLTVDSGASGDENNLMKLMRDKQGVVVTIPDVLQIFLKRPQFEGKLKISEKPLTSKSYFFPISKKSALSDDQIKQIWDEISKVRQDQAVMAEIVSKY